MNGKIDWVIKLRVFTDYNTTSADLNNLSIFLFENKIETEIINNDRCIHSLQYGNAIIHHDPTIIITTNEDIASLVRLLCIDKFKVLEIARYTVDHPRYTV